MATHGGFLFPDVTHDKWSGSPSWLSAPVANNHDSAGYAGSSFIHGAHTSTQPVNENPVTHSGVRLPGFADDFYNRILIEPNHIDAGNLVTQQYYDVTVFNGYFESKTLGNLTFDTTQGVTLAGPAIGTTWGALQTRAYQLTVSTDGPPNIDTTLAFDWPGIADDVSIKIVGVRIVMLPFQANTPWKETYEWKTSVLTTNSGKEQRIRLRKFPRQLIAAEYPIDYDHLPLGFNMATGWVGKRWAVGMWSETQAVGTLLNGSNSITCVTDRHNFVAGGLLLLWESVDRNEVLEIDTIEPGVIRLKRRTALLYSNATLMPVRMGVPKGNVIDRWSNGYNSGLSMNYEVTDNNLLATDTPTQYLNEDIYYETSLMGDKGSMSEQIKTRQDAVDFDVGVIDYFSPWKDFQKARNVSFLNDGAQEVWTFKRWLHRRAGRLKPYWLPTFEDNLILQQTGTITSALRVREGAYKNLGKVNKHLAILLDDGTWLPRTVNGVSDAPGGLIDVAIDSPLFLDASRIRMICFLGLHRLDTDAVEVEWIGNNISQSSIRILEIKP